MTSEELKNYFASTQARLDQLIQGRVDQGDQIGAALCRLDRAVIEEARRLVDDTAMTREQLNEVIHAFAHILVTLFCPANGGSGR